MPIYEYRCDACAGVSTILVRSRKAAEPACQHCGSHALTKLISTVARRRSVGDVQDEYGVPRPGEEYRDPRQIGAWVERRFEQYGMEVPQETRAMIDAAREGELPDAVSDL